MVNIRPHDEMLPTARQLISARASVGMSASELAAAAKLGVNTVRRAEAGGAQVLTTANAERLVATLEKLGVTFLAPDETGRPGLRIPSED